MKILLVLFICFTSALWAQSELVIQLDTEQLRVPVYLVRPRVEAFAWGKTYADKLQAVVKRDLQMTTIAKFIAEEPSLEKELASGLFEKPESLSSFAPFNPYFVVRLRMSDSRVDARVIAMSTGQIRVIAPITLTGNLNEDRQSMHLIADAIHKLMFNAEGISSTKIIYTVREEGKWASDVWESDYDGGNPRKVTENAGYIVTPTYIPPKPQYRAGGYFYVSYKTGQPKIYYGSLKEKEGKRLTLIKGNQLMPILSPTRDKIAFISDSTGNPDLFLLDFNPETGPVGQPRQIFAARQATQGSPCFSPNGKEIAFVSNKDGVPRIYRMGIPQGIAMNAKPVLVSKIARSSSSPAWSPDGNFLMYSASASDGIRQLCLCDLKTGKETFMTQGAGNKENPAWAPNGQAVIFNKIEGNTSELYLMNVGTRETFKLTSGPGEKRFPSWEPF